MQFVYAMRYCQFGWYAAVKGPLGLVSMCPPEQDRSVLKQTVERMFPGTLSDSAALREELRQLALYFEKGKEAPPFICKVDMSFGTPFQRLVWSAVRDIACGQVRTYGWVAEHVGRPRAGRAVGSALAANPLPLIIPCHRVIRGDGGLGGFSASSGVLLKRRLLAHEGVDMGRD